METKWNFEKFNTFVIFENLKMWKNQKLKIIENFKIVKILKMRDL